LEANRSGMGTSKFRTGFYFFPVQSEGMLRQHPQKTEPWGDLSKLRSTEYSSAVVFSGSM